MTELAVGATGAGPAGVRIAPLAQVRGHDQIFAYFAGIVETLGAAPFVLQDYPPITNAQIPPAAIRPSRPDATRESRDGAARPGRRPARLG